MKLNRMITIVLLLCTILYFTGCNEDSNDIVETKKENVNKNKQLNEGTEKNPVTSKTKDDNKLDINLGTTEEGVNVKLDEKNLDLRLGTDNEGVNVKLDDKNLDIQLGKKDEGVSFKIGEKDLELKLGDKDGGVSINLGGLFK